MGVIRKLPYIPEYTEERITLHGYKEHSNIEAYRGAKARGYLVIRVDILPRVLEDVFSSDTICKYRRIIYNLISGNESRAHYVSEYIRTFYLGDDVFKNFLGDIVYFTDELKDKSLYQAFITEIKRRYDAVLLALCESFKAGRIVCITDSYAYLYAAVGNGLTQVEIPKGYDKEIVSDAEGWRGSFTER